VITVLGMLSGLFKKENSKDEAKNRLKLVLIQDRAMLPSGVLENMKDDILKVLSKYVEIEKSKASASKLGMYVDTSGRQFTNPIQGLEHLTNLKEVNLIFGIEAYVVDDEQEMITKPKSTNYTALNTAQTPTITLATSPTSMAAIYRRTVRSPGLPHPALTCPWLGIEMVLAEDSQERFGTLCGFSKRWVIVALPSQSSKTSLA